MLVIRNKKRFRQLYGEHTAVKLETLLVLLNEERISRRTIANALRMPYTRITYWIVIVDK